MSEEQKPVPEENNRAIKTDPVGWWYQDSTGCIHMGLDMEQGREQAEGRYKLHFLFGEPLPTEPFVFDVTQPKQYTIGDATMAKIFTPSGMTNVHDLQRVFDLVEGKFVELDAEVNDLRRDLKQMTTIAVDRRYMLVSYYLMLGPVAKKLVDGWVSKGVVRQHTTWGPDAEKLTGEERAQAILDMESAIDHPLNFGDSSHGSVDADIPQDIKAASVEAEKIQPGSISVGILRPGQPDWIDHGALPSRPVGLPSHGTIDLWLTNGESALDVKPYVVDWTKVWKWGVRLPHASPARETRLPGYYWDGTAMVETRAVRTNVQSTPAHNALESDPVTLRGYCQQLLDIIGNYNVDIEGEDNDLIAHIAAAVDPSHEQVPQSESDPEETSSPPGNQIRTAECDDKDAVPETGQLLVGTASTQAPETQMDPADFQLLHQLDRDNVAGGARPVIESQGWEQARRLSDDGMIAIESVGLGGRLHITRKGMKALAALKDGAPSPETIVNGLREAIQWCLDRDERNGSLPEAYSERLRSAIDALAPLPETREAADGKG